MKTGYRFRESIIQLVVQGEPGWGSEIDPDNDFVWEHMFDRNPSQRALL
jgi:hypothetical protein